MLWVLSKLSPSFQGRLLYLCCFHKHTLRSCFWQPAKTPIYWLLLCLWYSFGNIHLDAIFISTITTFNSDIINGFSSLTFQFFLFLITDWTTLFPRFIFWKDFVVNRMLVRKSFGAYLKSPKSIIQNVTYILSPYSHYWPLFGMRSDTTFFFNLTPADHQTLFLKYIQIAHFAQYESLIS